MNKILSAAFLIFCSQVGVQIGAPSSAFALNTFVGNGGSAGDMELLVTQRQLLQTLQSISNDSDVGTYCNCQNVFKNHSECAALSELSEDQKNYCAQTLKKVSMKARALLEDKTVRFNWTREDIYVRDHGQTTTVDAVANPQTRTVTINQNRFFKLPQTKRLLVLAHEIFHLVPIEEKLQGDSGDVGPFVGTQGARKLLNSMASGIVMEASEKGVLRKYRRALRRRKAHLTSWFDGSIVGSAESSPNTNVYNQDSYVGLSLKYRKYFTASGRLGFNIAGEVQGANENLLTSIDIKGQNRILGVGLSYRFMPFKNPLSFFGQSFINFDGNIEYMVSDLEVSDNLTSLESSTNSTGWSAEASYYLPLRPFWLHIGFGLRKHDYEHASFNLKKNSLQQQFKVGVSYAF